MSSSVLSLCHFCFFSKMNVKCEWTKHFELINWIDEANTLCWLLSLNITNQQRNQRSARTIGVFERAKSTGTLFLVTSATSSQMLALMAICALEVSAFYFVVIVFRQRVCCAVLGRACVCMRVFVSSIMLINLTRLHLIRPPLCTYLENCF